MKVFTHDEAMLVIEKFESILAEYNICIPSPEDDDREPDNMIGLYGSTYSDLLDSIEYQIIDIISRVRDGAGIISYEFSGTI